LNNTSISLYEPLSSNGNKAFLELKNEIEKNQRLSNSSLYNLSKLIIIIIIKWNNLKKIKRIPGKSIFDIFEKTPDLI
jgi:hypothetical protein